MKRRLLTMMMTAFGAFSAFAQFTAGNLAVYRYGDGTAMTNGGRVPVFVDEYTPSGTFVKTVIIPQTASGGNYGFEGLGLKGDGTFESEGYPVLSRDGSVLSIIGYNPAQSGEFVIGMLTATGNWLANTLVAQSDAIGTPRSAVVEGTSVYFNGYDNGVRYKSLGTATASTRVSAVNQQNAPRVLTITDLIYSDGNTSSTRIFSPIGTDANAANATPLPTTQVTFTTINYPSAVKPTNAHQMVFINAGTGTSRRTLLYLLDDNAIEPKIRKYRLNNGATDWLTLGSINVPVNTKSLTATLDGSGVKLYFISYGNGVSVASGLYTASDNFSGEGNTTITAQTPTLLISAPANTTFRGVTMAPGTNVLPVKLTAFNANEKNGTIRLNWSTASETNASHYNILRSATAVNFVKIDQVSAKGTTSNVSNYSVVDEKPLPGTNYYQLQQVDFDGNSETFGPVSATIPVPKTDFSILKQGSNIELNIYSAKAQNGKIEITDINGKINHRQSTQLEKGFNKITVAAEKLPKGLNVVVLNTTEGKAAKKAVL